MTNDNVAKLVIDGSLLPKHGVEWRTTTCTFNTIPDNAYQRIPDCAQGRGLRLSVS